MRGWACFLLCVGSFCLQTRPLNPSEGLAAKPQQQEGRSNKTSSASHLHQPLFLGNILAFSAADVAQNDIEHSGLLKNLANTHGASFVNSFLYVGLGIFAFILIVGFIQNYSRRSKSTILVASDSDPSIDEFLVKGGDSGQTFFMITLCFGIVAHVLLGVSTFAIGLVMLEAECNKQASIVVVTSGVILLAMTCLSCCVGWLLLSDVTAEKMPFALLATNGLAILTIGIVESVFAFDQPPDHTGDCNGDNVSWSIQTLSLLTCILGMITVGIAIQMPKDIII